MELCQFMHGGLQEFEKVSVFLFFFFLNPSTQYSFQQSQQNFTDFDTLILQCTRKNKHLQRCFTFTKRTGEEEKHRLFVLFDF